MSVKLLLDENLSPAAAVALIADGVDAYHLRDRGILGATDQELLERAFQEDRVLITSNVDDFDADDVLRCPCGGRRTVAAVRWDASVLKA